jgi:EmrB/QacA subfamily drug resistance transporter
VRPTDGLNGAAYPTGESPARDRRWVVLTIVAVAQSMVLLDSTVVNIALPHLSNDLHATPDSLAWVFDAYTLGLGGLLLLGGRAADLLGRRRVFLTGLALFLLQSALCGLAQTSGELIAARAVQGIGAGLLSPAALSIVVSTFKADRERHLALGVWGALSGVGGTIGVVFGGLVVSTLGWQWVFYLNLPIGGAALLASFRYIRADRKTAPARFWRSGNVTAAVIDTVGLVAIVYAITSTRTFGWASPIPVSCLILGMFGLLLFTRLERRSSTPLLPRRILGTPGLGKGALGQFFAGSAVLSMMFLMNDQAQHVLRLTPLETGLSLLPMGVVSIGVAIGVSRLIRFVGTRRIRMVATGTQCAGFLAFAALVGQHGYLSAMLGPELLLGAAVAGASLANTVTAMASVPEQDSGLASGLLSTTFQFGAAIGLAVTATAAAFGLTAGYVTAAVFSVGGVLNSLGGAVRRTARPATDEAPPVAPRTSGPRAVVRDIRFRDV